MPETDAPAKGDEQASKDDKSKGEQEQKDQKDSKADDDIEAVASQADKPDAVKKALQAERDAAKEAREKAEKLEAEVRKYQDRDKSEQEKLEDRAGTAEKRASAAELKLLRYTVAVDKGLPLELADRLQGDDKKALEQDADRLKDLVKADGKPEGEADGGKGEGGGGESFNDQLRKQAGRI